MVVVKRGVCVVKYNIDGVWVKGRVVVQTTCLQNPKFMSLETVVF